MTVDDYLRPRCLECGDCLLWQGAMNSAGNPVASIGGRRAVLVRRWVLEQRRGSIPPDHRVITTCGQKRCVQHLKAVCSSDVNRAIAARGGYSTPAFRRARQEAARKTSKMTMAAAREMRRLRWVEGWTLVRLAKQFGISASCVSRICRGQAWADPADPWAALKVAA